VKILVTATEEITSVGTLTKSVDGTFDGTDQADTTTSLETPGTGITVEMLETTLFEAEIITGDENEVGTVIVTGTKNTELAGTLTITAVGNEMTELLGTFDGTSYESTITSVEILGTGITVEMLSTNVADPLTIKGDENDVGTLTLTGIKKIELAGTV